jgi:hypothetical protein
MNSSKLNTRRILEVEVDGSKALKTLAAEGKYDIKSAFAEDEKKFPIGDKTKRTVQVELINFDKDISYEELLKKLEKDLKGRYRPATIEELLSLKISILKMSKPDLEKAIPNKIRVIAMGSAWEHESKSSFAPFFVFDNSKWELNLRSLQYPFGPTFYFAVVKTD